jgi:endonuclease/exonuclease/phosphatase (EEP) superfamily protein YafD
MDCSFTSGAIALGMQVLLIWISRLHPVFELANHFAVHGIWAGLLVVAGTTYFRRKRMAIFSAIGLAYLLLLVHPWSLYAAAPVATLTGQPSSSVKVLSWNLLMENQSYAKIEALVKETNADVLVLIETPPGLLENLPGMVQAYPLSQTFLRWQGGGICMFSRIPGTAFEVMDFECASQPAIVATIPSSTGAVAKLVGIHPLSPLPIARTYTRNKQLNAVASWARQMDSPVCVCGDFNTTPWTAPFQSLLKAGLRDSREYAGNGPSWPRSLGPFGLPIDHVLFKGRCHVTDRRVLSDSPGSDHAPITFTLNF